MSVARGRSRARRDRQLRLNALIDAHGKVVWCCLPRPDGDPVFHALLGGAALSARQLRRRARIDGARVAALRPEHRGTRHRAHRYIRCHDTYHRFRAAIPRSRTHLPAIDADAPRRAGVGATADPDRVQPGFAYGEAHAASYPRKQPCPLCSPIANTAPDHGRPDNLRARRVGAPPRSTSQPDFRCR